MPNQVFFLKSGVPMPVVGETDISFEQFGFIRNPVQNREMSKPFPSGRIESLWLQLRAFTGMSSRAETLLYLLINDKATIQEIADQTYFAWRSIQDVLFELGHTGLLNFPVAKKGRVYRIDKKYLINMFVREGDIPESWICWPPLFRVLEQIWMTLNNQEILKASRLEQAAILRRFTEEQLLEKLEKSQIGSMIGTSSSYQDEAYLDFWQNSVIELLEIISGKVI